MKRLPAPVEAAFLILCEDKTYGFVCVLFEDFIIGTSDLGVLTISAFAAGRDIIRFRSSSEGMPGVGVAPGLILPEVIRLISSSEGMPGVGVAPLGSGDGLAEMPSAFAAEGSIGFALSPSGIFAGSILAEFA